MFRIKKSISLVAQYWQWYLVSITHIFLISDRSQATPQEVTTRYPEQLEKHFPTLVSNWHYPSHRQHTGSQQALLIFKVDPIGFILHGGFFFSFWMGSTKISNVIYEQYVFFRPWKILTFPQPTAYKLGLIFVHKFNILQFAGYKRLFWWGIK